jgi:hypothetical protein
MKLDEIFSEWDNDSTIDPYKIDKSAIDIAKLHHKYYSILSTEKLLLKKLECEMKKLRLDKFEFLTDGPTQEQMDMGWRLPPKGRIVKQQADTYMDADDDVQRLDLKIAYQKEKIDLLESIIKMVASRGFHLKTAIDFRRLQEGDPSW